MTTRTAMPVTMELRAEDITGSHFPIKHLCWEVWHAAERGHLGPLHLARLRTLMAQTVSAGLGVWLVAGEDFEGMLAGHIVPDLYTGFPVGQVAYWWVSPKARGDGLGGALLGRFEAWCESRGCRAVYVNSLVGMDTDSFFESHGYGRLESLYSKEMPWDSEQSSPR